MDLLTAFSYPAARRPHLQHTLAKNQKGSAVVSSHLDFCNYPPAFERRRADPGSAPSHFLAAGVLRRGDSVGDATTSHDSCWSGLLIHKNRLTFPSKSDKQLLGLVRGSSIKNVLLCK